MLACQLQEFALSFCFWVRRSLVRSRALPSPLYNMKTPEKPRRRHPETGYKEMAGFIAYPVVFPIGQ